MASAKRMCLSPDHEDEIIFTGTVIKCDTIDLSFNSTPVKQTCFPVNSVVNSERNDSDFVPPTFRLCGAVQSADFSHFFDQSHAVPSRFSNTAFGLDDILRLLFQSEHTDCLYTCMCKIGRRRSSGPIKEIIDHKWHGGKLFLLCKYHSQRACPEYLRLCQVNCVLREQYGQYLKLHRKPPHMREKWTTEHEITVRNNLYQPLSEEQIRVQEEVRLCEDTVEWEKESSNGKAKIKEPAPMPVKSNARPGPVLKTAAVAFYEVEQIVGASLVNGKRLYLVKWLGYPPSECSWEPERGLQMSREAIQNFHIKYGEPTAALPTVYGPDGLKFSKGSGF